MEAAKSAVNKVLHRGGQHDTHVEETVNPAVTQETVKPHRHENVTTAVDKEVHQDHYHTTVQPIQHQEVLPEKHTHQQMPLQEKEFRHGDDSHVRRAVETESAQFKDTSRVTDTTHSASQAPVVAGEHVHHHVHENVQPVIHKETLQPEVVHTTAPVHERHQAPSEHHGMSVLPTKTLDQVKNVGSSLTGGSRTEEHYAGHPKKYDQSMQMNPSNADKNFSQHDGLHDTTGSTGTGTGTGLTGRSATHHTSLGTSADTPQGSNVTTGHGGETSQLGQHQEHGLPHRTGHGTDNQLHHGTARDNIDSNVGQDVQHGTQSRDPALVEDKSDSKLKGQGVDGSHSALFGLTPDGHVHEDTSHSTTRLRPAHSKDTSNTTSANQQQKLTEQMNDPRVNEGAHGQDVSATGTTKPGHGTGTSVGSQGFGQVRPQEHGATDKMADKMDPMTDADRDGKRGVMD